MYYRRKVILAVLEAFGGELPRTDLQKLLFLLTRKQEDPAYHFVPHRYGCYSFQAAYDQGALIHHGELHDTEHWKKQGNTNYSKQLSVDDRRALLELKNECRGLRGHDLLVHVYRNYPYYAINSELAPKLLDDHELHSVRAARPHSDSRQLLTIGYEGKSLEEYLNQLIENDVRLLCDVRKNARSRKFGFNKRRLKSAVERIGIGYKHLPELGIASGKRKALESEEAYNKLFAEYVHKTLPERTNELTEVYSLVEKHERVALTCFEKRPEDCHRSRAAEAVTELPQWKYSIKHL